MRRELESKTASIALYSLLIFLVLITVEARDQNDVKCSSSSSSCGEIRNISYPFRVKGDPSGCGDPDYELSCVNNKTILEIFPGKYYVYNISYDDHTLRLVDANFADANASCSLPSSSVESTDGFVQDFRFRGVVPKIGSHGVVPEPGSRFRFVKCSTNISSLPEAANYTTVPCLTRNGTYFYAVYDGEYSYFNPQPSCSVVSIAPVDLRHNITYRFPSYGAVVELLQAGFEVGWSVECRDCSLAGKGCVVESWDTKPLTYICERENKELTRTEGILIIVAIAVGGLIALVVIIVALVFGIRKCRTRRNAANNSRKNLSR